MIAWDVKYHKNCLSKSYRSTANKQLEENFSDHERKLQGIAFSELVVFINETVQPKSRLLSQFEDISAYNDKKEVILVGNHDVGEVISVEAEENYDDNGYILARVAYIIRRNVWI